MSLVPRLRFKEFSDDWAEKRLGDVAEITMGQSPDSTNYNNSNIGLPLIQGNADIQNRTTHPRLFTSQITKECQINDIIMSVRAPVGSISKSLHHACIGRGVCSIKNKKTIKNMFLYQTLISLEKKWRSISQGTTFDSINSKEIIDFIIYFPLNLAEQEQIASFLGGIDDKIDLLQKKEILLKKYKQGVLQKIFNQEIRFKQDDGSEFPDWVEKKLGGILKEEKSKSWENNQHQVLSSTKDNIVLQKDYFNKEVASSNNIGYKILRKNQLVFSPQNIWLGNININHKYEIGIVSPSYKVYNLDRCIDVTFAIYFFKLPSMMHQYEMASEQGASIVRRNLNMELFDSITFNLPSIEEQELIANFLTALDKKIALTTTQLEKTRQYKTALLQQLFI